MKTDTEGRQRVASQGNPPATSKRTFEIEGMHCASCTTNVERSLKGLSGVERVSVNLASERASVEFDPEQVGPDDFRHAVEAAGYKISAEPEKVRLDISGMHCASCVQHVEDALNQLPGVRSASVNLAAETAAVEYLPEASRIEDLQEAVERAGYSVRAVVRPGAARRLAREREKLEEDQRKIEQAKRRVVGAWALTLPIIAWMIPEMFFGTKWPSDIVFDLGLILLAAPVLALWGRGTIVGGFRRLLLRSPNMDSLIAMGTSVAFLTGFVTVGYELGLLPKLLNYSGVAAMIMAFHLTGRYVETKARGRTSAAIQKLLSLEAKSARLERDGQLVDVSLEEVELGDVLVIRPGEKVPTDGVVVEGRSSLDESLVSGESMPVVKAPGQQVIGATLNKEGLLKVRATGIGEDTFLAHVVRMVEEAQATKVPIQEFADRVTAVFVPTVLGVAALTFVAWVAFPDFFHGIAGWAAGFIPWVDPALGPVSLAIFAAVAVLVIACPCALGLATPTALMVGTGLGAESGVLIRSGEAIQALKEIDTLVLDKTGTITWGKPGVTDLVTAAGWGEKDLLRYAASAESGSEHPLGEAIVALAHEKRIELLRLEDFEALTGRGVRARVDGAVVLVGNAGLMVAEGVEVTELADANAGLEKEAKSTMYVAADGELAGVIAVADRLKPDSEQAIAELKGFGLDTVMLTGDNERTARAIAAGVGIDRVLAGVLPGQKVEEIARLQDGGRRVAMVGDGINDAPALKQADVGIAIGTGTDIAIEAGDVTLVQGDLSAVVRAIRLSRATFRKIRQNLFWAYFYNVIAIPIAVLGFLHPVIAEAAMAFSSVTVVTNANWLRRIDIRSS